MHFSRPLNLGFGRRFKSQFGVKTGSPSKTICHHTAQGCFSFDLNFPSPPDAKKILNTRSSGPTQWKENLQLALSVRVLDALALGSLCVFPSSRWTRERWSHWALPPIPPYLNLTLTTTAASASHNSMFKYGLAHKVRVGKILQY